MIEIFNANRTKSLGWFKNFKVAKGILDGLIISGELGESSSVLVCSYKGSEPQREYTATYDGKWHIMASSKPSVQIKQNEKPSRKKHWGKIYKSPVQCFQEGFPDWLNRTYQPV